MYYQASLVVHTRKYIRRPGADVRDYTLVDFGSVEGRVLLIASEVPFRRVIGVEFSPDLHSVAAANIAKYGASAC